MATRMKLSDEQIITVMKQLEAVRAVAEMARELGVSTYTIYAWKTKYGGMKRAKRSSCPLKEENNRLKKLAAEVFLDREMSKALITRTD